MAIRDVSARDTERGRNELRLVYDSDSMWVYVETIGNHDGVTVSTSVRLARAQFAQLVRNLGAL